MRKRSHNENIKFSNTLSNRKAQIHMSETIAVIFIFFVLILVGAIFYTNFQKVAFKEKQQELLGSRAIDTTTKTLFLPEFSCTKREAEPEPNCFDMMKVRHIAPIFKEFNQTYFELFSFSKITLKQIYPPNPLEGTPIYDGLHSDDGVLLYERIPPTWKTKKPTYFVVSLKDEAQGPGYYGYGYVTIEVYS